MTRLMNQTNSRGAACLLLVFFLFGVNQAYGHAFGQRFDLPLPLDYYLVGAAAAVLVSFILVALFSRIPFRGTAEYPHIDLMKWRWARVLVSPGPVLFIRMAAFALFAVTLLAGIIGPQDPAKNLLPTMVWIIWWTGLAYFCALIGDLWRLINPWNSSYSFAEYLYKKFTGKTGQASLNLQYPAWLGVWPASLMFLVFVWGELVWTSNAIPFNLAISTLIYTVITWLGMFLYGRETWLQRGETFTLFFGLLSRFSVMEIRKASPVETSSGLAVTPVSGKEWRLRPLGAGLLDEARVTPSLMVFVILMLSTVTFDGFMGTPLWAQITQFLPDWRPLQPILFRLEMWGIYRETALTTTGLILFPLLFTSIYFCIAWLMNQYTPFLSASTPNESKQMSTSEVAAYFVFSLLPIAFAYHLAHYFSYLLIVGQFIIPLISDPFGLQWDLFGTLDYKVNIAIVGARTVWNASIFSIVVGHIIAVYVAHILALRMFNNRRDALVSQLPMLILMVSYTVLSLWILAQPLIE